MYRFAKAIQNRFDYFLMTKVNLVQDAPAGADTIYVDDIGPFTNEALHNSYPTIMIMDDDTSGRPLGGGAYEGTELLYIEDTLKPPTAIKLQSPLTRSWTVGKNAYVRRTLNNVPLGKILLGEIGVVTKFPYMSIMPKSKRLEWKTLSSTNETLSFDIVVYDTKKDTQEATENILKLADAIEWILMSKLHIQPIGYENPWEVSSIAMAKDIQYGTIQKDSTFMKAATLNYEAILHFWRGYLTTQGQTDAWTSGVGKQNFGPLNQKTSDSSGG